MPWNWSSNWEAAFPFGVDEAPWNNITTGEMAAIMEMFLRAWNERLSAFRSLGGRVLTSGSMSWVTEAAATKVMPEPWSANAPVRTFVLNWWRDFHNTVWTTLQRCPDTGTVGSSTVIESWGASVPVTTVELSGIDYAAADWTHTVPKFFPTLGLKRKFRNAIANLTMPPVTGRESLKALLGTWIAEQKGVGITADHRTVDPAEGDLRLGVYSWDGTAWVLEPPGTPADVIEIDSTDYDDFQRWDDIFEQYVQTLICPRDLFGPWILDNIKKMINQVMALGVNAMNGLANGAVAGWSVRGVSVGASVAPYLAIQPAAGITTPYPANGPEPVGFGGFNPRTMWYSSTDVPPADFDLNFYEGIPETYPTLDIDDVKAAGDALAGGGWTDPFDSPAYFDWWDVWSDGPGGGIPRAAGQAGRWIQNAVLNYVGDEDTVAYDGGRFYVHWWMNSVNHDGTLCDAQCSITFYVCKQRVSYTWNTDPDSIWSVPPAWEVLETFPEAIHGPHAVHIDPGTLLSWGGVPTFPDPSSNEELFLHDAFALFDFSGANGFVYRDGYAGT